MAFKTSLNSTNGALESQCDGSNTYSIAGKFENGIISQDRFTGESSEEESGEEAHYHAVSVY